VADRTEGPDTIAGLVAYFTPYGHDVWTADATTSVAIVGRIAAATTRRASKCGAPPLPPSTNPHDPKPLPSVIVHCPPRGSISACVPARRSMTTARVGKRGAATVHCIVACVIVVDARSGSRMVRLTRRLHRAATVTLRLSRHALLRLDAGRVTFTVRVNGVTRAMRTINGD
jgi:hypothetical protein